MKIIDLEQGSPAWLSWRKTVITATDCAAIRGSSPWSTAYKAWQRKLGLIEEQKSNDFMERGKLLEPIIRERFIKRYVMNMTPVVAESSEYSFLAASLDGISNCGKYLLEVKTGGDKLHKMAKQKLIPEYYLDQIQQQLLVTGADKCFYCVGGEDEDKDIVIEVYPDPEFAKAYLPVARAFWKCVAFNEPPALQDSDYKDMSNDTNWLLDAREYQKVCEQIKNLQEIKESYRKSILDRCADEDCSGGGIKVMCIPTRGRVDYDSIPELKEIDLNKYRKGSTNVWRIEVS